MRREDIGIGRCLASVTWALMAVLLLSAGSSAWAASTPGGAEPLDLTGGPIQVTLSVPGESAWFRIVPPVSMEATHFEIETAGTTDSVLEIFASLADVAAGRALAFDDDSGPGSNAFLRVPIGFVGPYYLRAGTYAGRTGTFSLLRRLSFQPTPAECSFPSTCAVSVAGEGKADFASVLTTLRRVKKEILGLSPRGKQFAGFYWRMSKDLVPALVLDPGLRREVGGRLRSLEPLARAALEAASGAACRIFSSEDVSQLMEFRALLEPYLSSGVRAELAELWEESDPRRYTGLRLSEALRALGLLPERGGTRTLLVKVSGPAIQLNSTEGKTGLEELDAVLADLPFSGLRKVHRRSPGGDSPDLRGTLALEIPADELPAARQRLLELPQVEWVEESGVLRAQASTRDPYSHLLWGLDAIHAPEVWPFTTGDCETLVAILDTGVRTDLLEFAGRVVETKGYDFMDDDPDPTDRHGHGTWVASVLLAAANNEAAVAGVAPGVCFFPVKVLGDDGEGSFEAVATGIVHAADQGARVINISAGCDCSSNSIEEALKYAATQKDVIVVAAAGNDGVGRVHFPASSLWTLAVGAVDRDLSLAPSSNWGEETDLVAPGVDVVGTFWNGESCSGSGTSAATPHVAGVAALVRSLDGAANRHLVKATLLGSATDLGNPGRDPYYGAGLVDALGAVQRGATITVTGPSAGRTFSAMPFVATASGCKPEAGRWQWSSPEMYFQSGSRKQSSSVFVGWTSPGTHELTVTNPECPGAEGRWAVTVAEPEGQSFELISQDGRFDPARPTILFTHGWQLGGVDGRKMWSCVADCDTKKVAHSLVELLPTEQEKSLNRLQFIWSGAGQLLPESALSYVGDAAIVLNSLLRMKLGAAYVMPVHFVGHSLGTVVNAYAANAFLREQAGVSQVQFTALDRPGMREQMRDFGPEFFPAVLSGAMRPSLDFRLDNYWSKTGLGQGDRTYGIAGARVYNHYRPTVCPKCSEGYREGLKNSNDVGDKYFEKEGLDNDHSGVQQWYRWTMKPNSVATNPEACEGQDGSVWNRPFFFHGSLNPCRNGWHWSLFGEAPWEFPLQPQPDIPQVVEELVAVTDGPEDAQHFSEPDVIAAAEFLETKSGARVVIPLGTRALRFRLAANGISSADFVAVFLDEMLLWSGQATVLTGGVAVPVGPVPIGELTGSRTLRLQVVGGGGTQVQLTDLRAVRVIPSCSQPSTLCLTSGRFRVEAEWQTEETRGDGAPRSVVADDSGFFWFFDDANLELVVKVLDACGLNQRFWVFAAGLTDVGVHLRVIDTWTGEMRTYTNPLGTAFQPIQDTDAFPTCGASRSGVDPETGEPTEVESDALDWPEELAALAGGNGEGVSGKTLLLNDDRFAVTATWRTASGQSGEGTPIALTGDSGYFWFFDRGNIELVVKVLDGCGLNQRYWVFAGGLTNVEVTLKVRDTVTNETKFYFNPQGRKLEAITDTSAFASCGGAP